MKIMVYNDDDDDDDEGGYWWSFCISILLFKITLWWAVSTNHFNQTFFIRNVQCLILLYFAQYKINYACRHVSVIYNWFQSGFLLDPSLHSDHLSLPVSITPVLMDCPPILMSLQLQQMVQLIISQTTEDWFQLFWWQLLCHCMCKISCLVGSLNEKQVFTFVSFLYVSEFKT